MSSASTHSLSFNPQELMTFYLEGHYDQLSAKFITILDHFQKNTYLQLTPETQYFINTFVKNFLYFFTQADYVISEPYVENFIRLNPTITSLIAMSCYENTDSALTILKQQEKNFVKILTLYSCRNQVEFNYDHLFQTNHHLSCLWYSVYLEDYLSGLITPQGYTNLRKHILYTPENLTQFHQIADLFFGVTYIDGKRDQLLKSRLNQWIQDSDFCQRAEIQNHPHPQKIAILTNLWQERHSVHRTLSEYVASLEKDYDLTLIYFGDRNQSEISSFQKMIYLQTENGQLNIEPIRENDFMVIYYPDLGMRTEGILLSNLRLAPIQICSTGHPVSSFGTEIDYFISGQNVELKGTYQENYSERLVLLPGNGALHNPPNYQIQNLVSSRPEFIINCPWSSQKLNYPHLLLLQEIRKRAAKNIVYRFFSGGTLRGNRFLPFKQDLENILGQDGFELVPYRDYPDYMAMMEEGQMTIDSYHFGGSNVISDSLYLRKLSVTCEGKKWYNRIGSQLLREVGLSELIAKNKKDYLKIILKLIADDDYRLQLETKLKQVDLQQTIYRNESKIYFKKMIDLLIKNHDKIQQQKNRKPIYLK